MASSKPMRNPRTNARPGPNARHMTPAAKNTNATRGSEHPRRHSGRGKGEPSGGRGARAGRQPSIGARGHRNSERDPGAPRDRRVKRRDLVRDLESNGCEVLRERDRHTVYVDRANRKISTVPRHREINEHLARKICRDLEVPLPAGQRTGGWCVGSWRVRWWSAVGAESPVVLWRVAGVERAPASSGLGERAAREHA